MSKKVKEYKKQLMLRDMKIQELEQELQQLNRQIKGKNSVIESLMEKNTKKFSLLKEKGSLIEEYLETIALKEKEYDEFADEMCKKNLILKNQNIRLDKIIDRLIK